ncbi:MAG: thioesterase family protein [Kiloniellales bacterium]|nr:thioesterase family protein [Kiloniellales bacterium]
MDETQPLKLQEGSVPAEWVDEFGHMNMARYVEACDFSTYGLWEYLNRPLSLEERQGSEYAVVETHVNYIGELYKGDTYFITTQILGSDNKRIWMYHELYHGEREELVATNEVMLLGFDLKGRRVMNFNPEVLKRCQELTELHSRLALPTNASRSIGLNKRA